MFRIGRDHLLDHVPPRGMRLFAAPLMPVDFILGRPSQPDLFKEGRSLLPESNVLRFLFDKSRESSEGVIPDPGLCINVW